MIEISQAFLDTLATARAEAVAAQLAGGAVVCYPAPRPLAGGAPAAPAIARIPFDSGVGTASPAGLVITAPIEGQCVASGEIDWARIESASGMWLMDLAATDLHLDRTAVRAGGFVRLLSGVIR